MMQIRAHHIKWGALLLTAAGAIVGLYFLLAYIVLPLFWRHYEHQHALAGLTMVTRTASGIPGDPMNVGLVGSRDDVLCAMNVAGWYPADPITLRSSVEKGALRYSSETTQSTWSAASSRCSIQP